MQEAHMNISLACLRRLVALALISSMGSVISAHAGDRVPLVGTAPPPAGQPSVTSGETGQIIPVDPDQVPCLPGTSFAEVAGGAPPGTNYDGVLYAGALYFAERFAGQSVSSNGLFDVISGLPSAPLQPQAGEPGQNLNVFDYAGNVLTGLGPLGFQDIDAIGEGSIAIFFPELQAKVKLSLVGGNGGSASLAFYRADGSLIDEVEVSNLGDLSYGFGTLDGSNSIAGILIQHTDASGIGLIGVCYDVFVTSTHRTTWGSLKRRFR
jgi:hypothetical protein